MRSKTSFSPVMDYFQELSMGMSGDYRIAVEEGSTMIRVGTIIFNGSSLNLKF